MWTALFAIAIVASIGFALGATWLSPQIGNGRPHWKNRWFLMAEFAAGCRELSRAVCAVFEPKWPGADDASLSARGANLSEAGLPSLATRDVRDTTLLSRRMKFLHIDPDELARAQPEIFRQLAIRCGQCGSTAQCARGLSDDSTDPFGEDWKDYCPNAAMLSAISTLRNVGSSLVAGEDGAVSSMGG
jgi:hypothetical protein